MSDPFIIDTCIAIEGDSQGNKKKKLAKTKSAEDFKNPLLLATLKGHAGEVTSFDVSSSGKYLISTAMGSYHCYYILF